MGSKWLGTSLIAVLSLGVMGAARADDKKPADAPHGLRFSGEIQADATANLSSRVAGAVDKVNVGEGDRVKKGQVLIELSAPELRDDLEAAVAKLDQAKAEVEQAEAGVKTAQARLNQARAVTDAAQDAYKQAAASPAATPVATLTELRGQFSSAEAARMAAAAEVGQAEARVKIAQAGVAVALAGVHRAETQLSFTRIVAPFDGFVARNIVDVGTTVAPQRQGESAPLITIMRDDVVRVVFDVDGGSASKIAVGDSVVIGAPPLVEVFRGKVTRKAGAFESNGLGNTLRVESQLPNPDGKLRPGMSVTVEMKADGAGK